MAHEGRLVFFGLPGESRARCDAAGFNLSAFISRGVAAESGTFSSLTWWLKNCEKCQLCVMVPINWKVMSGKIWHYCHNYLSPFWKVDFVLVAWAAVRLFLSWDRLFRPKTLGFFWLLHVKNYLCVEFEFQKNPPSASTGLKTFSWVITYCIYDAFICFS